MIPLSDADFRRRSAPNVTVALIGLNSLVFLYLLLMGGAGYLFGGGDLSTAVFFHKWGFIPAELSSGDVFTTIRSGFSSVDIETPIPTWGTLFTSMFIHGGLFHFAGNMLFLWVFGQSLEDRMGHLKFLAFYLATGVAATLTHLGVDPASQSPLVGASGAISGVMGAYLLLYPYNRIRAIIVFFLITAVQLPAMYMLGFWFLLQVVNGLGALGLSNQVSVAFWAHIGGFVAGAGVVALYKMMTGQPVWPPRHWRPGGTKYWRGRPLD